ncbi:F-box domain-containing protein [Mycena sanguinolenta]|uniref:F-box domain-containing protein n=1 Tax=Mycena sanguinolenta TaxID=230812 RepID=A0A8H6YT87_9AGAR|nr:F-box domain-containing protein [Mycena sanguinolenta]
MKQEATLLFFNHHLLIPQVQLSPSMSVEELQARVAKLSAEIQTQKEVLRRLEESRWATQRELNAIHVPIAALPFELSSEIFLQCLPPSPSPNKPYEAPMLLMNVCRAWTQVALSTPLLWTSIDLRCQRVDGLQFWLDRAQHCPLSITLHKRLNTDASAVFGHYAPQLKHLTLCEAGSYVHLSPSFPRLETLTLGSPETLLATLRTNSLNEWKIGDVARLLSLAPNLVRFASHTANLGSSDTDPDSDLPTLILPNLRYLEFGVLKAGHKLMACLTLPALETLRMPLEQDSFISLSLFLQRSASPLRKLLLDGGQSAEVVQYLRLLPSLIHFDWLVSSESRALGVLTALFVSESLLPNLRSLKVRSWNPISALHPTALRMLSARHPQLARFHLFGKHQSKPDAEILDGFRRLVAEGMEIAIGEQTFDEGRRKMITTNYI